MLAQSKPSVGHSDQPVHVEQIEELVASTALPSVAPAPIARTATAASLNRRCIESTLPNRVFFPLSRIHESVAQHWGHTLPPPRKSVKAFIQVL
jgi:hypothetical protein